MNLTKSQLVQQLEAAHVSYQALEQAFEAAKASRDLMTNEVLALQAERAALESKYLAACQHIVDSDCQLGEAGQELETLKTKPTPTTQQRRVYEFNPAIPGDFARAAALAKSNRGSVKRMVV